MNIPSCEIGTDCTDCGANVCTAHDGVVGEAGGGVRVAGVFRLLSTFEQRSLIKCVYGCLLHCQHE